MRRATWISAGMLLLTLAARTTAGELGGAHESAFDPDAAERGRIALTLRGFVKQEWSEDAYKRAGALWDQPAPDPDREPEAYASAFRHRYGLHPSPYPNDGLPMGLRRGLNPDGTRSGLQIDCMACHGGSIGGTSYVGLGNTQLDLRALLNELTIADGRTPAPATFILNSSRGTNNAGQVAAVLMSLRNPDLTFRLFPLPLAANLPEMDTPAWWHLKRKRTMYYDGRTPADSVRTNMQFMLGEKTAAQFQEMESTFRDVRAYLLSLEPPDYPFPIDSKKAERGQLVFEETCARCHGTYGPGGKYPSKIIPLDIIGTDRARFDGLSDRLVAHFNASWFGQIHPVNTTKTGYQAPPLDGLWATAPYLHNGSVPTLHALLDSKTRPKRFTRPPSTDFTHYDTNHVGWKYRDVTAQELKATQKRSRFEAKFIVDTARFGLGNGGHTFGDDLDEDQRMDLIEYLKTL